MTYDELMNLELNQLAYMVLDNQNDIKKLTEALEIAQSFIYDTRAESFNAISDINRIL
jgi:hypothetical protein